MESGADTRANLRAAADEQVFQIPQVGDFTDLGSLLHEFGHILLGQSALDNPTLTDTGKSDKNDTELWCNEFAAHTLIPDSLITNITTRELNQQLVDNLARQTYTSTLTVLNRLYGAGLLSWDKYTTWYKKEEEQALEYLHNSTPGSAGGNFYNMLPLRASKTLTRAIITSTKEPSEASLR